MAPPKKNKKETFEKIAKELAVSQEKISNALTRDHPSWSTGSVIIDILTGIGGLPKGRIVEVYGPPSVGKSTLCWTTAAEVQRQGKAVVFLDFENGGDYALQWAKKLGVNVEDPKLFLKVRAEHRRTFEDGLNTIYRLLDSEMAEDIGLIIWDSIANASTAAISDKKNVEDSARYASKASLLTDELPKLSHKLEVLEDKDTPITVAFVNQIRDNMDAMAFGKKYNTPGGRAFEHNASMRIMVTHKGFITKTTVNEFNLDKEVSKIGANLKVTMAKTKHGQRERTFDAKFIFQRGFDNVRSLVELAIKRGDFEKVSAQKFKAPAALSSDGKDFEGTEVKLLEYYYNNSEAYSKLEAHLVTEINKTYWEKIESLGATSVDDGLDDGKNIDLGDLGND